MGAGASTDYDGFKSKLDLYDSEYGAKVRAGDLTAKDSFVFFRKSLRRTVLHTSNDHLLPAISIGDVVKTMSGGLLCEGVVIDKRGKLLNVDFGDNVEEVEIAACLLVLPGTDFEVGDVVEVQPPADLLFFKGHVTNVDYIGATVDVHIDGDDEDVVERGVTYDRVRKLMTSRPMALQHWHSTTKVIIAANKFLSHIHHSKLGMELITRGDEEILDQAHDNPFLNDGIVAL